MFSSGETITMIKIRIQTIAVVAVSGLLGYAAASARFDVFRNADAGPTQQRVAEKAASTTLPSIASQQAAAQRARS